MKSLFDLPKALIDRIMPCPTTGCWLWTSCLNPKGYGLTYYAKTGRTGITAHRVAYLELVGPIPDGMVIDHLCRNRACCNPLHLEVVTPKENGRRGFGASAINARKTHCKHGHKFTPETTKIRPDGRECLVCMSEYRTANREKIIAYARVYNKIYYTVGPKRRYKKRA